MITTSSTDTWTSAHKGHGLQQGRGTRWRNTALNAVGAIANGGFEACERVLREGG